MLKSFVKTQNVEKEKELMILMFLSYFVPMTQSYAGIISILSVQCRPGPPLPQTPDEFWEIEKLEREIIYLEDVMEIIVITLIAKMPR